MAAVAPLLETIELGRSFGGLQALRSVALRLERGEIRAIIGPNGAGKTTLVSIISGRYRPTTGRVAFNGRDITTMKPWDRVLLGIVYTFQVTSIYRNLSCYENVALPSQRRLMRTWTNRVALSEQRVAHRARAALTRVGLDAFEDQRGDALPYGHQRLLEVAMALALEPELLILDEPTQGLAQDEISAFCELVQSIAGQATVLLIEHNMPVVLSLAEQITVMDQGEIIAEGEPGAIESNPDVQRAYLGT